MKALIYRAPSSSTASLRLARSLSLKIIESFSVRLMQTHSPLLMAYLTKAAREVVIGVCTIAHARAVIRMHGMIYKSVVPVNILLMTLLNSEDKMLELVLANIWEMS